MVVCLPLKVVKFPTVAASSKRVVVFGKGFYTGGRGQGPAHGPWPMAHGPWPRLAFGPLSLSL